MINVLILDDDLHAIEFLHSQIEKHIHEVSEIFSTTNIDQAQEYIETKKPQILFLDVEMPIMTGFEFLSRQMQRNFHVIFTTAYSKYAIQAIRFSALDFLLKPVQTDELLAAFHRFMDQPAELEQKQKVYENLFENLKVKNESEFKLSVSKGNRVYFIPTSEISYCSAFSNYTHIHLKDKSEFTVAKTLKEFEEMLLTHNFIRTHKSYLVNLAYIKSCDEQGNLLLNNNVNIEVSRRRLGDVLKMLK